MREQDELTPAIGLRTALLVLLGVVLGAVVASVIAPSWVPGLTESLLGPSPKAYWYLSRASGLVGYVFLWAAVALGLLITGRASRIWPGGPAAVDMHQFASLLGIAFATFHGVILLGDEYMSYTVWQILLPFTTDGYRPLWVGLGQMAFYVSLIVAFSFYVRQRIGPRTWRVLHYGSFAVYLFTLAHGLMSGTDVSSSAVVAMYVATGILTYALLVYRILATARQERQPSREVSAHAEVGHSVARRG